MSVKGTNFFELKRTQGPQGNDASKSVSNSQETRETQEKSKLKGTDIYSLAAQGGNTDNFQNYDGFTKTSSSNDETKECEAATNDAKSSQNDAKSSKAKASSAADAAEDDKKDLTKLSKQTKTKEKQTISTVNKNNSEIESKKSENDLLEDEANSLNDEIESLMAEDGESFSPEAVVANDEAPAQAQAQAPAQGQDSAPMASQGADAASDSVMGSMAAGGVSNPFAMNSLPSANDSAQVAPTSETAVSAQTSGQGQKTQSQEAPAAKSAAAPQNGGSLNAFGSSMPTAKGKNADKINSLLSEVGSKQSTISSNTSGINSLRSTNNNLFTSSLAFTAKAKSTSAAKKASNQNGQKTAQATQLVGATTTTTGGVITGLAALKMSNPVTASAGAALMPWGIGTTAAGGATTTAGSFAMGKTTEGAQQAGETTSATLNSMAALNNAKKTIV